MLDDAAVFSILSKCFAPVDKAEWENLSAREAWAERTFHPSERRKSRA